MYSCLSFTTKKRSLITRMAHCDCPSMTISSCQQWSIEIVSIKKLPTEGAKPVANITQAVRDTNHPLIRLSKTICLVLIQLIEG
mmetsp:Transcript_19923/g.27458  ORF Transcript_19923/g.27458 Transcript_19923/m.27458 type:complete len:84 (+) Transcript_19923:915-1166(+)